MSYIFNNFTGERQFSEVVAEAKDSGYTEPDPRDDLSGMDVARKVSVMCFSYCKGSLFMKIVMLNLLLHYFVMFIHFIR